MQAVFLSPGPIWQIHFHSGTKAHENILLVLHMVGHFEFVYILFTWTENGEFNEILGNVKQQQQQQQQHMYMYTLTYVILTDVIVTVLALTLIMDLLLLDACREKENKTWRVLESKIWMSIIISSNITKQFMLFRVKSLQVCKQQCKGLSIFLNGPAAYTDGCGHVHEHVAFLLLLLESTQRIHSTHAQTCSVCSLCSGLGRAQKNCSHADVQYPLMMKLSSCGSWALADGGHQQANMLMFSFPC